MVDLYKKQKVKRRNNRSKIQNELISNDSSLLLDKEENGTLTESDIVKFRLLIAREPVIKYMNGGVKNGF